ncbi:uncharacterized protein METZ01_LOCUS158279 [marine metagenome]|uniref:Uncharacterized protein n=1 Tax=marine metagenome TaxID=408172 RepID=A0A382AV79_9ZZZZ
MDKVKPAELLSMDTPTVESEIPQYDCLQDAKTDLVLDQLVEMVHEIKGEIAALREIMTGKGGCNQGRNEADEFLPEFKHEHDHVCSSKCPPWNKHGVEEEYPLTNPEHTARFS